MIDDDAGIRGIKLSRVVRPIHSTPSGKSFGKVRITKFILCNYQYIESLEEYDNELNKVYEDNDPKTVINFATSKSVVVLGDVDALWTRIKKNTNLYGS